jgi:hypothetical protein
MQIDNVLVCTVSDNISSFCMTFDKHAFDFFYTIAQFSKLRDYELSKK